MLYQHKRLGAKGAGARFERITGVEIAYIQKLARLSASTRKNTIGAGHGVNRHQNPDQIARYFGPPRYY
jgi:anaerobic selenocysteine-containing dehydrogenase